MKIADILAEERNVNKPKNLIRLYKEGVWYRAYEKSAYLAHFFPNGLTEEQRLSPIHRNAKEGGSVISVGIKLDMMPKFMPSAVPTMQAEYADVFVDLTAFGDLAKDLDAQFNDWRSKTPIKEKKEQKGNVPQYLSKPMTFSTILKAIIRFQLECKTPEETYKFVRELKDMVAELI